MHTFCTSKLHLTNLTVSSEDVKSLKTYCNFVMCQSVCRQIIAPKTHSDGYENQKLTVHFSEHGDWFSSV
jgi:hypothetical protein